MNFGEDISEQVEDFGGLTLLEMIGFLRQSLSATFADIEHDI